VGARRTEGLRGAAESEAAERESRLSAYSPFMHKARCLTNSNAISMLALCALLAHSSKARERRKVATPKALAAKARTSTRHRFNTIDLTISNVILYVTCKCVRCQLAIAGARRRSQRCCTPSFDFQHFPCRFFPFSLTCAQSSGRKFSKNVLLLSLDSLFLSFSCFRLSSFVNATTHF
jgi:hypothetical protein